MRIFRIILLLSVLIGGGWLASPIDEPVVDAQGSTQPTIGGCPVFPDDHILNTPVDTLQPSVLTEYYKNTIGRNETLFTDFGPGEWPPGSGNKIGIPFITVNGNIEPLIPINYIAYGNQSDPGPMPIPLDAPIEAASDAHVLAIDTANCILYELYNATPQASWWDADSGAIYDLEGYTLRPEGWTSADAAGLPIFPLLLRYDEVQAAISGDGMLHHAIRFTVPVTQTAYVWPARHQAGSQSGPQYPPMGLRLRLEVSEAVISTYSPTAQVILRTLKTYGMILADNGTALYLNGVPDDRWNNDHLRELMDFTMDDFVAVNQCEWRVDNNSAATLPAPDNKACPRPPTPVQVNPAHLAHQTNPFVTFSWNLVFAAQKYRVFVFDNKITAERTVDIRENTVGAPTSHTLSQGLSPGRYFWRVRERRDRLWSAWSTRRTFFIDPQTVLPAPQVAPQIAPNVVPRFEPTPVGTLPPPPNSR
ncbi:MAG: hypothetical protein L0154_11830 [Chloroflexi bacterium]|nr:hypothetical protein [Chloroflexota bacterium]